MKKLLITAMLIGLTTTANAETPKADESMEVKAQAIHKVAQKIAESEVKEYVDITTANGSVKGVITDYNDGTILMSCGDGMAKLCFVSSNDIQLLRIHNSDEVAKALK